MKHYVIITETIYRAYVELVEAPNKTKAVDIVKAGYGAGKYNDILEECEIATKGEVTYHMEAK